MIFSRVGPKGQVVIPKALRDRLGIAPGDHVVFDVEDGKAVLMPVRARTASDLLGVLRTGRPLDLEAARRDYQNHLVDKLHHNAGNE
ncbi:MAG: AbrB/MazE/SpoVT family DNA-binding domain-containing protein [Firmicutes bacterium]|nr:AbrB/MazE/SpoVT family DNA-binding domain-containing protein [Alicyclobacillaceae bacterium]MCL6498346.1 AbrB/MazE/SpoVT family DNA-binding domain-containing protein [Bacillota bacterium]